jgi:hypothetical protein
MVKKVMRQGCLLSLGQFPVGTPRGELTQSFVVVVVLDGTCPLQSSILSTQAISTGLSTETLEGLYPNLKKKLSSFFALRLGLSIP